MLYTLFHCKFPVHCNWSLCISVTVFVEQVVELMGEELGWWYPKRQRELKRAKAFLSTFTSQPEAPGVKSATPTEGTDLVSSQNKGGGA